MLQKLLTFNVWILMGSGSHGQRLPRNVRAKSLRTIAVF